jgi:hypothetical protein
MRTFFLLRIGVIVLISVIILHKESESYERCDNHPGN